MIIQNSVLSVSSVSNFVMMSVASKNTWQQPAFEKELESLASIESIYAQGETQRLPFFKDRQLIDQRDRLASLA